MKHALRGMMATVAVILAFAGAGPAFGAAATWVGNTDTNWATAANWSGNQPTGNTPNFGAPGTSGSTLNNNLTADASIVGISFLAAATTSYTLNGNRITLGGNISTASGAASQTINLDMVLSAARQVTAAANADITLGGTISGNYGVTLVGNTGTINLNGLNTFGGQLSVSRGNVNLNSLTDIGFACALGTNGVIGIGTGGAAEGVMQYTGGGASCNRQIAIGSTTVGNTLGGGISANGSGGLTFTVATFNVAPAAGITGARTLTLAGTSTGTNEIKGVIQDNNTGGGGLINLTVGRSGAGNATWRLSGTNTYTGITALNYGGVLEATVLTNGGVNSSIGASGNAATSLVFGNSSGVAPGTLRYVGSADVVTDRGFGTSMGVGGGAIFECAGSGTFSFDNTVAVAHPGTANQARYITLGGSNTGTNTFGKTIANNGIGAVSLNKTGVGRWLLTGGAGNTHGGATAISGGVLEVGSNAGSLSANSYLKLDGGVLQASGSFTRINSTTASGANLQWSSANGGGFSARGGKLTVTINGSVATEQTNATAAANNGIWGSLMLGSTSADAETEFQNNIDLNGNTLTVDVASGSTTDFATLSGIIRNSSATSAGILKVGTGTLKLTGANTYNGGTTLSNGTLLVNNGSGSGTGTNTVTVSSGTLGGTGLVAGAVTIANTNTAALYPRGSFAGATLTCGTNVTFSGSNARAKFDLSSSVSSGNDKVVLQNATLTCGGATVTINSGGTLAAGDYTLFDVGASGTIPDNFASTPLWTGTAPAKSNQYSITKDTRYVYLHYTALAAAPTASNDTASTYANSAVTVNVTTNDASFNPPIYQVLSNLLWGGSTVQIANSTNLLYTPAASSNGTDQFQYVITNAYGSATGTVTVTVLPLAGPTAGDDNAATAVGNAVTINVTTNDSNFTPPIYQVLSNQLWAGSTVAIAGNTNLVYTPASGSNGVDTFQYVITNASGAATGTVNVTVSIPPLTAGNDSAATTVGNAVTINATTNDANFVAPIGSVLSNLMWAGSTVSITGGTNLYYTPAAGSNGVDQFQYVVTNAYGQSATGLVSVTVAIPPLVASNDTATTIVNGPITINVTTNDLNFVAPIASATPVTWAGSTVVVTNGTNVFYTPAANSNETDSFKYVITNAYGQSATGLVTVTVTVPAKRTWDGGGADDQWSTGANWDFDAAPVFPVALTFAGSSRLSPSNDYTGVTNNGIVFDATAGAFTLGGNAITLAGNITNLSTATQTINMAINLGSSTRNIHGGSGGITLGGTLSGTGGLTLPASSGTLTLSGNSSYGGGAVAAASTTLIINHANALGTGTLTLSGAGSIDNTSGGAITITNNVTLSGNSVTFIGTTNLTIDGTFTASGGNRTITVSNNRLTLARIDGEATGRGFTKSGAGTLTITGAAGANLTGPISLSAGTLVLGDKNAMGGGALSISAGATLQAAMDLSGVNAITNALTLASGAAAVTLSGANDITFSAACSLGGSVILTNNLAAGKTLTLSGNITNSNTSAGRVFTIVGTGDTTISGVVSDGLSTNMVLTIGSTGTTTLSNTNTYGGATTINGGMLRVKSQTGTASGTGTNTVSVNAGGALGGNGRVGGVVTIANTNTALLYPNHAFAGGTLTCATNVTFSGSNAVAKFDLSGSAAAGNDKVVLENAKLTCGGATVMINCTGTVDMATDYVLFDVGGSGTITGSFARVPQWAGTPPKYAAGYVVTNVGTTNVVLRYAKIPLTVTAQPNTKGYDGDATSATNPAVTGTLATGDTGHFTQTYANKHVGTGKTLTPSGTVSNEVAADVSVLYAITFVTTNAGTITARPLTVTAVPDAKVYDGTTDSTGTPTVVGTLAAGDSATWTQRFDNANVGTGKTLTPTGTVSDANSGNNYAVTFVPTNTGVIAAAPLPPTVVDDTAWTPMSTPVTVAVAANDLYSNTPIGAVLSNLLWAGSTAVIQDSTNILYTPAANSNGTDTFQYVMTNAFGSATGTVTVTVVPLLIAASDAATTFVNSAITIPVTTNDAGFVAPIASVTTLGWGGSSVSVTNGTEVYYTPAANSNGVDTFRYVITNSVGQSATGLVTVTVMAAAASRTWDGGGGDDKWSTAANWDSDVTPLFPVALTFTGSTRLTPSNDYVGVTNNSIAFDSSAGAFTLGGNAIRLSGNITNLSADTQTINLAINLGSSTRNIYGGASGIILGGSLSGTGGISLPSNSGTVTLSGSNAYSGATTVGNGAILNINHANALGSGTLTFSTAGSFDNTSGGVITITNNASLGATSVAFLGTTNCTINGTLTLGNTRTINVNSNTLTLARIDAAGFGFTKGGAGTLAIAAGTDVQGTVTLNAGTLILGDKSVAGSGPLSLETGTLQASTDLSGANALGNAITVPNATSPTVSGTNSITLSGAVAIVNSRTLTSSLAAGKTLTFAGSVTNSGTQNSTFTIGGMGATTFSGGIANGTAPSMSLAINNSGVTTFAGTNTYTGTTTVNGGLLKVNGQTGTDSGTGTNTVTVAAGGALGGNGRVGGAVTIANTNTAMLYPNNAFAGGTLTCATNVTFSGSNAVAKFDLSGSAVSGNDKVVLGNAKLTCGGATVMINATGRLAEAHYLLFDVGSGGAIAGSFASVPAWAGTPPAGSSRYDVVNVGGTNIILHYTPPPGTVYVFR